MANIFLTSDHHFRHRNMTELFKRPDGSPIRPFATLEECDEAMIDRWNATITPSDHVWHLGDFAMNGNAIMIAKRLHGHKRLIRGNHDIYKTRLYLAAGFSEIYGSRVLDRMIFTHIPIHSMCLGRFIGNIHGHIHEKASPPGRYLNVCVEMTDYTPIPLEEAKRLLLQKPDLRLPDAY